MNKRLIFLHLPKNGGTTFKSVLHSKYAEEEIFQVGPNEQGDWNLDEFKALPQVDKDRYLLLAGHFNFGLHTEFTHPFEYVTMLRHLVERTVSFYEFVKRQKMHRLLEQVMGKSLIECVIEVADFDVVNSQSGN